MNENLSNNKLLNWLALAFMAIGLVVGLATLAAPAGTWLGFWEFGQGFQILGVVINITPWVAAVCLLASIILGVVAHRRHSGNAVKLFSLAFTGALAAAIAWYIPSTFQARLTYPVIHDVSTDVVNPPSYVVIAPLRADAPNTMAYGGSEGMTPEENARLQQDAFPDLVPRLLDATPQEVFDRALAALEDMGLEIVAAVPEEGRIEAIDTTFWFRFKDDVVIRIRPEGSQTRIDARSLSRVGRGDAGTNGLRLQDFFSRL